MSRADDQPDDAAAEFGRRGGRSRTPAQQAARVLNMKKARLARWAKHHKKKRGK